MNTKINKEQRSLFIWNYVLVCLFVCFSYKTDPVILFRYIVFKKKGIKIYFKILNMKSGKLYLMLALNVVLGSVLQK